MRLEGKNALDNIWGINLGVSQVITSCYGPFDPRKNFIFKCEALAKKISNKGYFGIIFDYKDDSNYSAFYICKGDKNAMVHYERAVEGKIVGTRTADIKLKQKRKAAFDFELRSSYDKVEFYCNDMLAMEVRYNPVMFCGIGFSIYGQQTVDFDNVQFIQ